MNTIKKILIKTKYTKYIAVRIKNLPLDIKRYKETKKLIKLVHNSSNKCIYYIGVPVHSNLGDLAQGVCIRRWLKKNYPDYRVIEIETDAVVNTFFSVLNYIKKQFNCENDFVVFQSGYTTTDLGGHADIMHQAIMKCLPNARILMMPQTIFFLRKKREKQCSQIYNQHRKMLFLARDAVSYEMAKKMFPDIPKLCYPDIVTTLIGSIDNKNERNGIVFCLRNDGEKFYSNEELKSLMDKCSNIDKIYLTDTTKTHIDVKEAEKWIYSEIDTYSKYKVMVTDRYHGTILSLVAGTPVIIIKTKDHKVTTGADWFKGVYDNHVYLANNLEEAYNLVKKIYERPYVYTSLPPYFEENYYAKLPELFKEMVK